MLILSQTYNPHLDAMDLESMISWKGADAPPGFNQKLAQRIGKLVLEDGAAGMSIAAKSGAITSHHPTPFSQTDIFKRRIEES